MKKTEKEILAEELVIEHIKWLKQSLLNQDEGANYYCNKSEGTKCTLYGGECRFTDKSCFNYDISELINGIDKILIKIETLASKDNEPKIKFETSEKEMINHPSHYNMGKYEAIDVIEDWELGFNLGNTIKYISRAGHKDDIVQDLKKAMWYLDREIQRLENK